MSEDIFKIGAPTMTININLEKLTPEMREGLQWWSKPGPRTDCPFANIHPGKCKDLCGKLFMDIKNVYEQCPFKKKYSEKIIQELVLLILSRTGK